MVYENSWLSLIDGFGILGAMLVCMYLYFFVFKTAHKKIILFSIPWLIYTTIFPILQELTALFITWFILSLILNEEKAIALLFEKKEVEPGGEDDYDLNKIV